MSETINEHPAKVSISRKSRGGGVGEEQEVVVSDLKAGSFSSGSGVCLLFR